MQEPPWLPRTNEEYLQQLAADAGPQPDEFIALQAELEAADGEIAHLTALLAERDAEIERLVGAEAALKRLRHEAAAAVENPLVHLPCLKWLLEQGDAQAGSREQAGEV